MKKILFIASALAGLFFAASCQQENLEPVQQGNTVTYTVQVPGGVDTKSTGDGFTLTYEVYRQNDLTNLDAEPVYEGTKNFENGSADITLEFVKDQKFTVLFWAQQTNGAQAYVITDLREVSLNTLVANDLTAEVFAGNDHVNNCVSDNNGNVVLVRPVAQINIATDADSFTLGTEGSTTATVVPDKSKVVVDGLYGTYNVANGAVATKLERTYTETNVLGTEFKSTYKLMATNYLGFIPEAGDNVKVTFYIYTQNDGTIEHTVSNVPVKANYQTNILGNLITATEDYHVTLEEWADEEFTKNVTTVYDAESAQEVLDNATKGTTILLHPGVNYGTLEIKANPGHSNTTLVDVADAWAYNYVRTIEDLTIIGADGAKVDGIVFKTGALPGDQNNRVEIKNLTIENVEFTDAFTASPAGYNAPIMITTSNATVDGLTVKNCKLIGDNSKLNLVYLYGADGSKNVTLTGNTVSGIARLCELRGTENVTITNNVINDTYEHAMLLAAGNYAGNVTITGNTADGIHDRFVRMAGAGDAVVVIKNNTIANYLGEDKDYIKVTDGNNVTVENNTCSCTYTAATVDELKSVLAKAGDNAVIKLAGVHFGGVDLYNSTNNGHRYNYANYEAKNVKIVGDNGASFSTLRLGENDYAPTMTGWTFENITFTGNGLQISMNNEGVLVQNCKFINSELMNTGTDAYQAKNFTVQSCSFEGSRPDTRKTQLALQNSNGVKISDCTFTNSGYSAINVSKIYGDVEITGNNINQTADRPLRFVLAANNAILKITDNTIVSGGDDNGELMKVSAETGIEVTAANVNLSGNTWNDKSDAEITASIVDGNYIVK